MGTVVLPSTSGRPDVKNKKKSSSLTGRKKTPTYGTAHPPTMDDAVHPPPTHRPNRYYIPQYSSSAAVRTAVHLVRGDQLVGWFMRTLYKTGNRRGKFHFLTILERAAVHHPPTTHYPPTDLPSTAVQQCSST